MFSWVDTVGSIGTGASANVGSMMYSMEWFSFLNIARLLYAGSLELTIASASSMPQYTEEGYAKAKGLLDLLHRLAEEKRSTPAQISLAWMICRKPYIIPIPGSRKAERLRENLGAGEITLTPEEVADIDTRLDGMDFDVFGGHSGK